MENQTRFDLNAARENWRRELAAQPNLSPEARRELETHMLDAVVELQRRGLNDEESFWLARHRMGHLPELGQEFEKSDPFRAGREQALLVAGAFLALYFWQNIARNVWYGFWHPYPNVSFEKQNLWFWVYEIAFQLAICLPLVWLVFFVARGRSIILFAGWHGLNLSRKRFIAWSCILLTATRGFDYYRQGLGVLGPGARIASLGLQGMAIIWPGLLIAVIAWLFPREEACAARQV